jgi:hypothetical protein
MTSAPIPKADITAKVALADAVMAWCARSARRALNRSSFEDAARWCQIAGEAAEVFACSQLASEPIESILRDIGQSQLPRLLKQNSGAQPPLRWLHVLTHSFSSGGHTAFCRRWIGLDSSDDTHDLALTFQSEADVDATLLEAVTQRGGRAYFPSKEETLLGRAEHLRSLAGERDVVVLHIHVWDPVPTIAFASSGGPPVLILNHADHLYWTGSSIADLILNIRPSGEYMCKIYRGCDRIFRLPIPLPVPTVVRGDRAGQSLRAQHGIPASSVLFLTIGSAFKYTPMSDFSFIAAAKQLLMNVPGSYLIAVGPNPDDPRWKELRQETQNRARAVGVQRDLDPYLAAADVYLEGFPFGSLTALLEATLAGVTPVLAPKTCPLPYRSDDFSIADLPTPEDINAYVEIATEFALDATRRENIGERLKKQALAAHCGSEWSYHLDKLRDLIWNEEHRVTPLAEVAALPQSTLAYWANFSAKRSSDLPFGFVFREALKAGLRPQVDSQLFFALRSARKKGLKVRSPTLTTAAALFLSRMPKDRAVDLFCRV